MLEKIQGMSRNIFLLFGLALGAGLYYNNISGLESLETQIQAQKAEIKKAEDAILDAQKVAADKKRFEEEVTKVSDQLKAALEFLPTSLREQEVLTRITGEARSAGVNPTSIQPQKPVAKAFYEELLMDVEMEGSYTQLVMFLAYISKIQRIVNIRGLDLKVKSFQEDVPLLRLKGTLVAYRYLEGK